MYSTKISQVVAVWQNYANSPELEELGAITKDVIEHWRQDLLDFQSKINKKYATSLCEDGSGSWIKDTSKKVMWLKEKEDIIELRRKLHIFSDTIMLLSDAAQKYVCSSCCSTHES